MALTAARFTIIIKSTGCELDFEMDPMKYGDSTTARPTPVYVPRFRGWMEPQWLSGASNSTGWTEFADSLMQNAPAFAVIFTPATQKCQKCGSGRLRYRPSNGHSLQLATLSPADSKPAWSIAGQCRREDCKATNDYWGYHCSGETWTEDASEWAALEHPVSWARAATDFVQVSEQLVVPAADMQVLLVRLVRCGDTVCIADQL